MNVYVVMYYNYSDSGLVGIYATKRDAIEYLKTVSKLELHHYEIEKWNVRTSAANYVGEAANDNE